MNEKTAKVLTGRARLSYAHLFKARAAEDGGVPKFSGMFLIPKKDTVTLNRINAAIDAAKRAGIDKFGGKVPVTLRIPLRDGDTDPPGGNAKPELAGMMFITASTTDAPLVVGEDKQEIIDQSEVYSGCYVRASITFVAYNHKSGGKGVGAYLNGVQKVADGEPFGAARENADTMFGDDDDEVDLLG